MVDLHLETEHHNSIHKRNLLNNYALVLATRFNRIKTSNDIDKCINSY
jgi:hypothetical protein